MLVDTVFNLGDDAFRFTHFINMIGMIKGIFYEKAKISGKLSACIVNK